MRVIHAASTLVVLLFSFFHRFSKADVLIDDLNSATALLQAPKQESYQPGVVDSHNGAVKTSTFSLASPAASAILVSLVLFIIIGKAPVAKANRNVVQWLFAKFLIYALSEKSPILFINQKQQCKGNSVRSCHLNAETSGQCNNSTRNGVVILRGGPFKMEQSLKMATLDNPSDTADENGYIRSRRDSTTKMKKIMLFADQDPQQQTDMESFVKVASEHRVMMKPNLGHIRELELQSRIKLFDFNLTDEGWDEDDDDDVEEVLNLAEHPEVTWSDIEGRAHPPRTGCPLDGEDTGLPPKSLLRLPLPTVGAIRLGAVGRSILEVDWDVPQPTCRSRRHWLLSW